MWVGLCVLALAFYGGIRLYFLVTDGFCISNIASTFPKDSRWDIRSLTKDEQTLIDAILSREFFYLGKGCQSYVFLCDNGEYVLKFFKYQRFRPKFYLYRLTFISAVERLLNEKIEKKNNKLERLFQSWKTAFDNLQEETGLVYIHLNKTDSLHKRTVIYDKMGGRHELNMDEMEFLIQKKTTMLCSALENLMAEGKVDKAKGLLARLVKMVISEYHRGFADNDHALMQNTGVFDDQPIHVDVGQFVKNQDMQDPMMYHQELFNKMFKFRLWLAKKYPDLRECLDQELCTEIGDKFFTMKHKPQQR